MSGPDIVGRAQSEIRTFGRTSKDLSLVMLDTIEAQREQIAKDAANINLKADAIEKWENISAGQHDENERLREQNAALRGTLHEIVGAVESMRVPELTVGFIETEARQALKEKP